MQLLTYDGANNMAGRKSGAATQISNIQPKALPAHCHHHSVSLTVKDVTFLCKLLRDTMGTVAKMTILVKDSPKREKMLGSINKNIQHEDKGADLHKIDSLSKLFTTRRNVRVDCFR